MEQRTVAFHTLGCKLNFSETSTLSRSLQQEGFSKKEFTDIADVYVINTCSVTDNADKECRQLVRRILKKSPSSMVVITGCYAQLKPKEIASIPGVDLVLGAAEKFNIAQHLSTLQKRTTATICSCDIADVKEFTSSYSLLDRTRTFLKVQDGCNYTCSFCTIPMARGASRSDAIANVVLNAQNIAASGVKEIVLTGVNLGDFTTTTLVHNGTTSVLKEQYFIDLLRALDQVQGIERFRISSIEPNLLTNEIIEFVANSNKIMPHFHIPLQSGSDAILGLMRRRYKRALYASKVALIKALMPHCCIGVDVIVGFPGESEAHFKETVDFLNNLDVSYLHVFTYSERDHTKALDIKPVVPIAIRNERNKILRNLSYKKQQYFNQQYSGSTRKVLFEKSSEQLTVEGYTDNYIKVVAAYNPTYANTIIDWVL